MKWVRIAECIQPMMPGAHIRTMPNPHYKKIMIICIFTMPLQCVFAVRTTAPRVSAFGPGANIMYRSRRLAAHLHWEHMRTPNGSQRARLLAEARVVMAGSRTPCRWHGQTLTSARRLALRHPLGVRVLSQYRCAASRWHLYMTLHKAQRRKRVEQ